MDLTTTNQTIQYAAWFLAIVYVVIGLYIVVLNPRHRANRLVSVFLLVSAMISYAFGMMVMANSAAQGRLPAILLAITTYATAPLLLASTIALLKPDWLEGRRRWWQLPLVFLALLPLVCTLIDLLFGTRLWFAGIDPNRYQGGIISPSEFTGGSLALLFWILSIVCFSLILFLLIYIALFDKKVVAKERRLAGWLLFLHLAAGVMLLYLGENLLPAATVLIANGLLVIGFAYVFFRQMGSARLRTKGSLQMRLIAVMLVVAAPVMIATMAFITNQARILLEQNANQSLQTANQHLYSTMTTWLDANSRALQQLAAQPDIASMDPARQQPILHDFANIYPDLKLVSTTDLSGQNLARSDGASLEDYSQQGWFKKASSGAPLALESLIEGTSGKPVLVASVPIVDNGRDILGVVMFATKLEVLNEGIKTSAPGSTGYGYIVDDNDQLIAGAGLSGTSLLQDFSTHPAVVMLRQGSLGPFAFADERGVTWRAKADLLPNGWGVIVQAPEQELLGSLYLFERVAWLTLIVAGSLLVVMAALMIRQTIRPIRTLTHVTAAVTAGDLSQIAPVESDDELGVLASAFNTMTIQIRDLITGLETRVRERTSDLERRAVHLQVAAEVAQEAASIHDLTQLLDYAVQLISDRFGFYHAGIFLIDDAQEYAVLAAASSEGGHRMLGRGHKLKIGEVGIVGFVAGSSEPRIALDVGRDAIYFNNPDLPQTRSEMALPMVVHKRVIGVLDVQSTEPAAFTNEDLAIMQVLADQIALAFENTRLLQTSQHAVRDLESLIQKQIETGWQSYLEQKSIAFAYDRMGIKPLTDDDWIALATSPQPDPVQDEFQIALPIQLRGNSIGYIKLNRESTSSPWSREEKEFIENTLAQVSLALENARLQENVHRRAEREHIASRIAARTQSSLDLETVMKRAVQEIGQTLKAQKVQIRLHTNEPSNGSSGNSKSGAKV